MGKRALWTMVLTLAAAAPLRAQDLADFDYENLAFRGVGLEWGYIWPDNVVPAPSYGVRMDLGYLGPGLRIVPSLTYWSSRMKRSEVVRLEERLEGLVARTQPAGSPPPVVTLGRIGWSDLSAALDGHVVWRAPRGFLTFAGAGVSVHFLNGDGDAIAGTFIEDLLDNVSAGFDLQAGVEYPLTARIRPYLTGRLELLQDIRYAAVRGGLQILVGSAATDGEGQR